MLKQDKRQEKNDSLANQPTSIVHYNQAKEEENTSKE